MNVTNSSEDGSDSAPGGDDGPTPPDEGGGGASMREGGGQRGSFSSLPDDRTFRGGSAERDQVIVLPPPKDDEPTWRSPRNLPWWAWIPVLLLVGYGVYEAREQGWLELGESSPPPPALSAEERAAALERAEAERRFRQVADSLGSAVQGYDVRRSDFEQNRIECGSLAAGYRRVDRHFVQLSVLMKERGGRLDAEARNRYETLTERVDEVNRHFDGTACRADA